MSGKYTVISLFAGGGGSSLGYHLAGYKELLAIDFNENATETLKANFKFPIWKRDVTKIKDNEILDFCKIKKGELDVLDGSPPCQGFSIAGKRRVHDPRNELYKSYIRLLKALQPKVFVMENVTGMIKGSMKGRFNEIFKDLKSLDYNIKCKLMNSKYYSVPQARERIIFIGIRKDLNLEPVFPEPNKKIISVLEILKTQKNKTIENGTKVKNLKILKVIDKLKPGEGCDKYLDGSYYNMRRCYLYKPSQTITKTVNLIHPIENRYLSISEAKLISSFPEDFILTGPYRTQWARLGNSVMPNMMKAIAENIRQKIFFD